MISLTLHAAILREDAKPDEVWKELGSKAKKAVIAAQDFREQLTKSSILQKLRSRLSATEARALGIEVIREAEGRMTVGMFDVPQLGSYMAEMPKSE